MKSPCVYILASKRNGVLYIGVTSDLAHRMSQHNLGVFDGFTEKYAIKQLVYYEHHLTMNDAIAREKRMKDWKRAWKVGRIERFNPEWRDLFDRLTGEVAFGPADLERQADEDYGGI